MVYKGRGREFIKNQVLTPESYDVRGSKVKAVAQKGFSQNILPGYSAKGRVHNCLGEGIGGVRKGVEWGMRCN